MRKVRGVGWVMMMSIWIKGGAIVMMCNMRVWTNEAG